MLISSSKYFARLNDEYHMELVMRYKQLHPKIQLQVQLFEGLNSASHVQMGLFYELLTMGIFGGSLVDSVIKLEPPSNSNPYSNCKPDIENGKTAVESKAIRQGHQLNLLDDQMHRYRTYQIFNPERTIYFAIWRHSFKNIKGTTLDKSQLIEKLCSSTMAGIIVPFSIIWTVFNSPLHKRYEYENEEEMPWPKCTRWGSKELNNFILNPQGALEKHGLDAMEFKIQRCTLPTDVYMDKTPINKFPMVVYKHLNYRQWANDNIINYVPF